jgi:NAD(P)-dependent dehydrogenase (short-subunit alcohol dehydrogenase family)
MRNGSSEMKPEALLVYGPMSNAISDFLEQLPAGFPLIRLYGSTEPKLRENSLDIQDKSEILGALNTLNAERKEPCRLGFLGAAVATQSQLLVRETAASIDKQLYVNIANYVAIVQECLPYMVSTRYGRFVYLSSFRAQHPTRGVSIYAASKAFGETFFKAIGLEYARFGVSSVSIRMGYFHGGLLQDFSDDRIRGISANIARGRLGTPADLTPIIELAMQADYLNGSVIGLDGGLDF